MLIRYAEAAGDREALDRLTKILGQQLEFMLPDRRILRPALPESPQPACSSPLHEK